MRQVSEALAVGLPVVMSQFTKESFGTIPGCVGPDDSSFAKCVTEVHDNKNRWKALRNEGISYIQRTHNREKIMEKWSEIIDQSFKPSSKEMSKKFLDMKFHYPTEKCAEGEEIYLGAYKDVADAVKAGHMKNGFDHWRLYGKLEGRSYYCNLAEL